MRALDQVGLEWPAPAAGPEIFLPENVAQDLVQIVIEAANSLPRRGLEVSGLLLGNRNADRIEIRSLLPLPCDYPEGPAFRLSEEDLRKAVAEAHKVNAEVVGIYRSRTDDVLDLDSQDELLLKLLDGTRMPVLLIQHPKDGFAEGRLFVWGADGETAAITGVGEIFSIQRWMAGEIPPAEPREERRISWHWWMAAALLLLLPLLVWRVQVSRAQRTVPSGGEAKVEGLPTISNKPTVAEPASLPLLKQWVRFDKSEWVRRGAVRELARRGQNDPEILLLLRDRARSDPSELVRSAARQELAAGSSEKDRSLAVANKPSQTNPPLEPNRDPAPDRPQAAPFQMPLTRTQVPQALEAEKILIGQSSVAAPDLSNDAVRIPLPDLPSRAVDSPAIAVTEPVLALQPKPIVLPPDLRRLLQHEVLLSLRIQVDPKGRVSAVYPADQASTAERSLWVLYEKAVRSWVFEPARRNNLPVEGETILRFRVTPSVSR